MILPRNFEHLFAGLRKLADKNQLSMLKLKMNSGLASRINPNGQHGSIGLPGRLFIEFVDNKFASFLEL